MRRVLIVAGLVLCLIIGGVLAQETSTIRGGDEAALRAFIARYIGTTSGNAPIQAMIGELPALAFTLPLPPDTTILGTIVRPDGADPALTFYEIFLENTQSPADVLAFYKTALATDGWALIFEDDGSVAGGFIENNFVSGNFCRNATEVFFAFDAGINPQAPGTTLINVRLQTPGDIYQCQLPDQPIVDVTYTLIPPLRIPEGVTVISNVGGGLSYYAADARSTSVTAIMTTTVSLAQLNAAYQTQLVEAGWVLAHNDLTERTAFSTWTIAAPDGSVWQGALLLLADTTTPGQYNAMVWVEE